MPHAQPAETNASDSEYEWRDDERFEASPPKTDPWKNLNTEQARTETTHSGGQENIPTDWYETEDPERYTRYFRAQLIQQFGDIPEVHVLADTTLKIKQNRPLTYDEYIADLEAQYTLWPDERTRQVLEDAKREGNQGLILFSEDEE